MTRVYEIGFLKSSELYLTLSLQGEFLVGNIARAALGSAFYGSKASSPRDCFGHQLWIIKGSKVFLKVLLGSLIFCWRRVPWGSLGFFGVPKGFEGYLKVAINSLRFHRVL